MTTFGKIIGGGLPVGAYGGSADIMKMISPEGPVYQAGTLSGNPLSVSAGIAQLTACLQPNFYDDLYNKTKLLADTINLHTFKNKSPVNILFTGSIFWIAFSENCAIRKASEINSEALSKFKYFHAELLNRGVYIGPSGYEVCFVSAAHSVQDINYASEIFFDVLSLIFHENYHYNA